MPLSLRFALTVATKLLVLGAIVWLSPSITHSMDIVEMVADGKKQTVEGRVLVEAQDGGVLLEGQDGRLWALTADKVGERRSNDVPFEPWSRDEVGKRLLAELPEGFQLHTTAHYVIAYNTSRTYAQWCGALFEQLYRTFFNHWQRLGLKLEKPTLIVACVFRDQSSYIQYSRPELGEAAGSIIGYYSLASNRITTYDLTGIEQLRQPGDRVRTQEHIQMILSRPSAERTVATVIHEATHQLAFNSGLQRRFADNPFWLSEGLAIYFESPDLSSRRGWRRVGEVNEVRLDGMLSYLPRRPQDSLFTLLTDDQRFRNTEKSPDAYAEAWSLCYYLIRKRPKEFARYIELIGEKPALGQDTPEQRLQDFQKAFGGDLTTLDREFLRALETWRGD